MRRTDNTIQIPRFANYTDTDFRAEVVASSLLQYYREAGQIWVKRMGNKGRAKKKDIQRIKEDFFQLTPADVIIETNRESLYDYMPEGIFHKPTLGKLSVSSSEIIAAIRKQRKQEADNRQFFSPFEQEAALLEMFALYKENRFDCKGIYDDLLHILFPLWPLLEQLDADAAKVFIYLLPFFYMTKGNKYWFTAMLQALLHYPVTITDMPNRENVLLERGAVKPGRKRLGIDTVLCGSHYDGNINWQLTIGPVAPEASRKFLPGSKLNMLLQAIYTDFVPEGTIVIQQLNIERRQFSPGRQPGDTSGYLGYTTFL